MRKTKYTFKRWFNHWCAFQSTAIKLKCWKPKYLFHDIDKPFLGLFMDDSKIKSYHRKNSNHHVEYKNQNKYDYYAMIVDWECSGLTKDDAKLNAWNTYLKFYDGKISNKFDYEIETTFSKLNCYDSK